MILYNFLTCTFNVAVTFLNDQLTYVCYHVCGYQLGRKFDFGLKLPPEKLNDFLTLINIQLILGW